MMRVTLSIDPGRHAGAAVWHDDHLVSACAIAGDDVAVAQELIESVAPDVMVVEDQYPGPRMGARAMRTLVYRRAIWEVLGRSRGCEVHLAHPSTWMAWCRPLPALTVAASIMDERPETDDVAAAVCIGAWYLAQSVPNVTT